MPVTEETYRIQSDLAAYCRTSELPDIPGLTPGRVAHYRRLVYNIIDDTFEGAFPITRSFLSDEEWHELVNDFFATHACQHPSIWKLPYELYEYLVAAESPLKLKYPFLTDLIYFEWLEIDVHTMPDEAVERCLTEGSWLQDKLVINKEFRLVPLNYPVHLFKPLELIEDARPGNYFVLVYRLPLSGNVQFFNLSPFYAVVVSRLAEGAGILKDVLSETCGLFEVEYTSDVENSCVLFLEELKRKEFIFGFSS